MKKVKILMFSLFVFSALTGCMQHKEQGLVNKQQLKKYLTTQSFKASTNLENVEKSIDFWEKEVASSPNSMTFNSKLASAYNKRFGITKDVQDLHKADSLYNHSYNAPGGQTVGSLQTLSHISVTKHHFKQAQQYALDALQEGYKKQGSYALLFDAMMERGDYKLAKENLDQLSNTSSFGYLTRMFKYKDYEGDLDAAIHYIEKAAKRIDYNPKLRAWASSNLGDLYGHANRVEDSYASYLKVLDGENTGGSYLHALKGIAWIAYAHDQNFELAKEILTFVDNQIKSPDVKLTLAKIAKYQQNNEEYEKQLQAYVNEAKKSAYYGMYDAYLINLVASKQVSTQWAMNLAEKELNNRPNPNTFGLQAWVYFHQGEMDKALNIIQEQVDGQTAEPLAAYHMAKIYEANRMKTQAKKHYERALASSYELGPVVTKEIKMGLTNIKSKQLSLRN